MQNALTTAHHAAMMLWQPSASTQSIYRLSAHTQTDGHTKVKTVYPPVSLLSLGRYNEHFNGILMLSFPLN